tara:strand:+ start:8051 stop:8578 length:528 start_codon:yes stop_codon:yes gene_type:complete
MSIIPQSDSKFTVELTGTDLEEYIKNRFPKKPTPKPKPKKSVIGTHQTTIRYNTFESFNYDMVLTDTIITYHNTDVIRFNRLEIELNTGGWTTNTTKKRMNQTSEQFNLGFRVFQKNWEWFVVYEGRTYLMNEETEIYREDNPLRSMGIVYDKTESKRRYKKTGDWETILCDEIK